MTTPTGQIAMSDVNTELGLSATAQISLDDAVVRSLAGIPSGQISLDDLRGKSTSINVYWDITFDDIHPGGSGTYTQLDISATWDGGAVQIYSDNIAPGPDGETGVTVNVLPGTEFNYLKSVTPSANSTVHYSVTVVAKNSADGSIVDTDTFAMYSSNNGGPIDPDL